MGKASMTYKEVRFKIEKELTHVYIFIEANGDCPFGVQGWRHKAFPASQSIMDIINGGEFENSVFWPLNSPSQDEETVIMVESEVKPNTAENKLFCYGCCHSSADDPFPGKPSGERPCCFCTRNNQREEWLKEAKKAHPDWFEDGGKVNPYNGHWYDGNIAVKCPMDCYHSLDMLDQINKWLGRN